MNVHAIDQKEIRGVNARHIIWLIVSLCSILIAVISTYYATAGKIDRTQERIEQTQKDVNALSGSKDVQDAQIKALNLWMQQLEIRIVRMETQLGINRNDNNAR